MPPPSSPILTPAEKRIMNVLWRKGEGSVNDVQSALKMDANLAYNTVLSLLRTMTAKGYVKFKKIGRAHIYSPALSEKQARDKAIKNLLKSFFGNSPHAFAQHLVHDSALKREDLDALMYTIIEAEKASQDD